MYLLLKFIHIVAVTCWVGGMVTLVLLNVRLAAAPPAVLAALGQQGRFFSMALFMPAAALTLITGIGMVQVGQLGYSTFWITWGFTGTILSFIVGGVLTGGTAQRMSQETDPAVIAGLRKRLMVFASLNLLILLSVVWAMVIKP